jgi:hypothetical protein
VGFISNALHNHHMKDPVRGEALVVEANDWTPNVNPHPLKATLVVHAEGVPKTTVEHDELVGATFSPTKLLRWPTQGDRIPVTIDRADPTRVRIEWDDFLSHTEQVLARSEERKQQLLAEEYGPAPPSAPKHKLP